MRSKLSFLIINMENFESSDFYGLQQIRKAHNCHQYRRQSYLMYYFNSSSRQQTQGLQTILQDDELKIYYPEKEHIVKLNFKMLFQTISYSQQVVGFRIRISRKQCYQFYCPNKKVIEEWKAVLSRYVFIWGFYEDFKPLVKIGKGKTASVFLALRRKNCEKVAIKAFKKNEISKQPRGFKVLQNQIKILRQFSSPYIMKYIASYETQKTYYLVTEYIEGKNLKQLLQERPLAYYQSINILKQLGNGLKYLAERDIAHRDIKPDNIIITNKTMSPVIVDFGLATKCKQGNYIYNHCGTPGYVAPEILSAKVKTITPNVDIFSLGIVFYMMLFRKFPYSSKELNDILKQNKAASFDLFSLKQSMVPCYAISLLEDMLQSDPIHRVTAKKLTKGLQNRVRKQQQIQTPMRMAHPLHVIENTSKLHNHDRMKILRSRSLDIFFNKKFNKVME